jgi:hypothetical protein
VEWFLKFHDFRDYFIVGGKQWNCSSKVRAPALWACLHECLLVRQPAHPHATAAPAGALDGRGRSWPMRLPPGCGQPCNLLNTLPFSRSLSIPFPTGQPPYVHPPPRRGGQRGQPPLQGPHHNHIHGAL